MNFHNLMIITAITTIGFGTGFIIAPKALIALYGLSSTPIIEFSLRLYATAIFGIGALALLIRHAQNKDIQKAVLLAFFIIDFGGFLVALFANVAGLMNFLGWSLVVLFLIFSGAYAYLYFFTKSA